MIEVDRESEIGRHRDRAERQAKAMTATHQDRVSMPYIKTEYVEGVCVGPDRVVRF